MKKQWRKVKNNWHLWFLPKWFRNWQCRKVHRKMVVLKPKNKQISFKAFALYCLHCQKITDQKLSRTEAVKILSKRKREVLNEKKKTNR